MSEEYSSLALHLLTSMQDAVSTKTTIRLFPSEESTFDSDTLSDDAKWQYYVASYQMTDQTEGVDLSQVRWPFLRRSLSPSKGSIEETYSAVIGNLHHEDSQVISISPDNYKMYYEGGFTFYREVSGPEKKQEHEGLKEKLVERPGWAREEGEAGSARRMAAWRKALEEDLSGYEDVLARAASESGVTGDVALAEGTTVGKLDIRL